MLRYRARVTVGEPGHLCPRGAQRPSAVAPREPAHLHRRAGQAAGTRDFGCGRPPSAGGAARPGGVRGIAVRPGRADESTPPHLRPRHSASLTDRLQHLKRVAPILRSRRAHRSPQAPSQRRCVSACRRIEQGGRSGRDEPCRGLSAAPRAGTGAIEDQHQLPDQQILVTGPRSVSARKEPPGCLDPPATRLAG